MMRILVGLVVAGALAGCSTPIPLLGLALDGKVDVQIEAKVIRASGDVVPVADTGFSYSSSAFTEDKGTFTTDFDGKAKIRVHEGGTVYLTGFYRMNGGQSQVTWSAIPFHNVNKDTGTIRLSNSNASEVRND